MPRHVYVESECSKRTLNIKQFSSTATRTTRVRTGAAKLPQSLICCRRKSAESRRSKQCLSAPSTPCKLHWDMLISSRVTRRWTLRMASSAKRTAASWSRLRSPSRKSSADLCRLSAISRPVSQTDHSLHGRVPLRLADRFSMQFVLHSCEEFLRGPDSEEIPLVKRLLYSENYRLASLQSVCLNSLKSMDDVKVLKTKKGYCNLSDKTKAALGERILELS